MENIKKKILLKFTLKQLLSWFNVNFAGIQGFSDSWEPKL